jgi:hypothetical protein
MKLKFVCYRRNIKILSDVIKVFLLKDIGNYLLKVKCKRWEATFKILVVNEANTQEKS